MSKLKKIKTEFQHFTGYLNSIKMDFMMSLSDDKQAEPDVIDAFNTTSRYFDDILKLHSL